MTKPTTYSVAAILDAGDEAAKDMIRHNLRASYGWLERGVLAVYRNQTADEQQAGATVHENGKGFSGADSRFMSAMAKVVLDYYAKADLRAKKPRALSQAQADCCLRSMVKYAGQLLEIARATRLETATNPTT